jgi:hypothetical protein
MTLSDRRFSSVCSKVGVLVLETIEGLCKLLRSDAAPISDRSSAEAKPLEARFCPKFESFESCFFPKGEVPLFLFICLQVISFLP